MSLRPAGHGATTPTSPTRPQQQGGGRSRLAGSARPSVRRLDSWLSALLGGVKSRSIRARPGQLQGSLSCAACRPAGAAVGGRFDPRWWGWLPATAAAAVRWPGKHSAQNPAPGAQIISSSGYSSDRAVWVARRQLKNDRAAPQVYYPDPLSFLASPKPVPLPLGPASTRRLQRRHRGWLRHQAAEVSDCQLSK